MSNISNTVPIRKGNEATTEVASRNIPLNWEVFVTPSILVVISDLPPGVKQRMWSPISSILIFGERDAVLVDAFITVAQTKALVAWVAASGKNLTTIYATHGHGDHFFGIGALLDRFPNAKAVATPDVVKIMRRQASPEVLAKLWSAYFPDQVPERLVIAEELGGKCDRSGRTSTKRALSPMARVTLGQLRNPLKEEPR